MRKNLWEIILTCCFVLSAWFCGSGCANVSVTLQSNRDPAAMHRIQRLFVIIDQGVIEKQPTSKRSGERLKSEVLAASLQNCLSNTPVQLEINIVNPVALNGQNFESKIREFQADAVLVVRLRNVVMDQFGGCPIIYYDASLYNEITQKYVWRALIKNSGDPAAMNQRTRKMAEAIVAQLRADGFLEPPQA